MRNSSVSRNTLTIRTGTSADVGPSGTVLELDGPGEITDSRITDNSVRVLSSAKKKALAQASSGLAVYDFSDNPRLVTLRRVLISGNTAVARSRRGTAEVVGVGIFNNGLLSLYDVEVRDNTGTAKAPHANAEGAGIWNRKGSPGQRVELALHDTRVTANRLVVSAGGTRHGGGLFTNVPVTLDHADISGNAPDQCYGC